MAVIVTTLALLGATAVISLSKDYIYETFIKKDNAPAPNVPASILCDFRDNSRSMEPQGIYSLTKLNDPVNCKDPCVMIGGKVISEHEGMFEKINLEMTMCDTGNPNVCGEHIAEVKRTKIEHLMQSKLAAQNFKMVASNVTFSCCTTDECNSPGDPSGKLFFDVAKQFTLDMDAWIPTTTTYEQDNADYDEYKDNGTTMSMISIVAFSLHIFMY